MTTIKLPDLHLELTSLVVRAERDRADYLKRLTDNPNRVLEGSLMSDLMRSTAKLEQVLGFKTQYEAKENPDSKTLYIVRMVQFLTEEVVAGARRGQEGTALYVLSEQYRLSAKAELLTFLQKFVTA